MPDSPSPDPQHSWQEDHGVLSKSLDNHESTQDPAGVFSSDTSLARLRISEMRRAWANAGAVAGAERCGGLLLHSSGLEEDWRAHGLQGG